MSRMITRHQAAQLLNVDDQSVSNWVANGILKGHKVGHQLRVDRNTIDVLFDSLEELSSTEKRVGEKQQQLIKDEREIDDKIAEIISVKHLLGNTDIEPYFKTIVFSILRVAADGILNPREYSILRDLFDGEKLEDISLQYNISRTRVQQIIKRSLHKIENLKGYSHYYYKNKELLEENTACHDTITGLQERITQLEVATNFEASMDDIDKEIVDKFCKAGAGNLISLFRQKMCDQKLSVRTLNCLRYANIVTVGDLVKRKTNDLLKIRNFGKHCLHEVELFISGLNLNFGLDVDAITSVELKKIKEQNNLLN